jgi:predicted GTPase
VNSVAPVTAHNEAGPLSNNEGICMAEMKRINTIIIGAAGRDFHNFNVIYRDNELYNVVAFTATQIPNISGRKYPAALAGRLYPDGIPIYEEKEMEDLIPKFSVD